MAMLLGLSACGGGAAPASSPAASVPAASVPAKPVTSSAPAKGPLKLDSFHDVVENSYIYQMEQSGNGAAPKLLQTFTGVSQFWDRTPEQLAHFNYGKMRGQCVGMTKGKLGDVITPPKSNG